MNFNIIPIVIVIPEREIPGKIAKACDIPIKKLFLRLKVDYDLYLYDMKGSIVKSFINQTNNTIRLEKEFSKGIYHLQLISSSGNKRTLLVVK